MTKLIYYIFLIFLTLIALLLIVSVLPVSGNYKVLVVLSGSMEPTIKKGSVVIVKPAEDYKIGDIITFGSFGRSKTPITHRIYDIKVVEGKPFYITKGDANKTPDSGEISSERIIGKVLFSLPYFGYAVETAKKPWGFAFLIIIPAVIIITDEVKKIVKEIKRIKKKC